MKVFFTGSVSEKQKYLTNYKTIIDYLKKHNHDVIYEHILNHTEETIRNLSREDRVAFLIKMENWIKSSHFVIAETSHPSVSVGYQIALALRFAKPVLVLYSEGDPPSLLLYHTYDRLHTEHYKPNNVGTLIEEFIHYIEGKHDTRFTFFLPEELNAYLEDSAHKDKLTKSMYIRRLIEKDLQHKNT